MKHNRAAHTLADHAATQIVDGGNARRRSVAPGMVGDVIVFAIDHFAVAPDDLATVQVSATIVDGAIAFHRGA